MASCDNTVLTGQEGLIQFKPLGTTNCVDDYCPFMGDRVYLPCAADYDIGDCLTVDIVKIPVGEGQSADGSTVIADGDTFYVVDDGKGTAGDVDACGNDMEGVPYMVLSASEGGAPITWDNTLAGQEISSGGIATLTITDAGTGYNGSAAGTLTNVDLINTAPTRAGSRGRADVVVGVGGIVASVTITSGGENYVAGDTVYLALDNGGGTVATMTVTTLAADVRSNSSEGNYVFRLCDFQTVCGVRSFSLDLSRDELDVTTLPCSVSEACGKELASFRKTQAGFATATGTLEVYFTCDNESIQNKILQGSLQRTQGGASVRLYVCTKTDAQGEIDVDSSLFIEADIQLLGMSFSVNPDDPTTATINFGVTSVQSAFGLT
jgi:hypothetical protein